MTQAGLTKSQRDEQPWGLPPSVLAAEKVITDPVQGDIHLNRLEVAIANSGAFQRLRRVRQLGTTHLVYPGATHTRFSHSLGAVRVAQRLLDQVLAQRDGLHATPDLFGQLEGNPDFEKKVAEAVVLARLGALLHDLCHVPVGHSVEDDLGLLEPHDENQDRFDFLWGRVRGQVNEMLRATVGATDAAKVEAALFASDGDLHGQLVPLILSKVKDGDETRPRLPLSDMTYPFVADLVGNTICADLLDYLNRDHLFTGLPASIGDRFISAFYVVPEGEGPLSQRMALNIHRDGRERVDIVSELLKALRYRYELSERALYHHAKLSADAMLGEAIERWASAVWLDKVGERLEVVPGHEDMRAAGETYKLRTKLAGINKAHADDVDAAVRAELEQKFRTHGDDGLLEMLAAMAPDRVPDAEEGAARLRRHAGCLARAILDRQLFKIAGVIESSDASARNLYTTFGLADKRDALERDAQTFAELGDEPRVVLWLPDPSMRLKLAQVLVRQPRGIVPFVDYEASRSRRGSEIYAAHERLWRAYVFVHRDVPDEDADVVAARLAAKMGVRWRGDRFARLGPIPNDWLHRLAIERELGSAPPRQDEILARLPSVAARSPRTFRGMRDMVAQVIADDA